VSSKIFDCVDVMAYGIFRKVTTPELFQHHFAKSGHGDGLLMTRQPTSTVRQPPLHYLTRSVRRTSGFVLADNPEVISHGTPIRDARCDHFYGKRVFRPSRLLPSGSSCALSLTRMDEASNWARGARRYYYEAFRTATEIREGKAA